MCTAGSSLGEETRRETQNTPKLKQRKRRGKQRERTIQELTRVDVKLQQCTRALPVGAVPEGLAQGIGQHGLLEAVLGLRFLAEVDALFLEIGDARPIVQKNIRRHAQTGYVCWLVG